MKIILSWEMGVESTTIFLKWIENKTLRDFDLRSDLIVLTSQTGDEYGDQKPLVERHILPIMREHGIRYVQIARAGHLGEDGIVVLSDTREPHELHVDGAYKLSDELRAAGTVPQFAGEHRCSLKKYWVRRKKSTLFFLARGVGTLASTDRLMQNIFRFPLASFKI